MTFYGTGILDQSAKHLTKERVESGFTPRCLVVVDERDHYITSSQDVKLVAVNPSTGKIADKQRDFMLSNLIRATTKLTRTSAHASPGPSHTRRFVSLSNSSRACLSAGSSSLRKQR